MSMNLEEAKAYLQKESEGGLNLYDHLSEVLLKLLVEKPENSCEAFEHISEAVKQAHYKTSDGGSFDAQPDLDAKIKQEKWCDVAINLLKPSGDEEASPASGVSDLLDESNMFEWAGLGFSKGETFRLSVALQNLATTQQATNMRFWGKILGRDVDFYIAEGQRPEAYEPEDSNLEEGADGANKLTYWALKDDGSYVWEKLPPVTREQILSARMLKRYVGGDLDAKVPGNPPFPGSERNFLRAQIARISASTTLCPSGFFNVNEDGECEIAEEIESRTAQELLDAANWVHLSKELNAKYGRSTPMPPREGPDGEEQPWEGEEFVDALRSLSEDADGSWKIYSVPAMTIPTAGEVAVVKSLVWPGAASIGLGKKFINVYVGDAIKYNESSFQPQLPAKLQSEYGVTVSEAQESDTPALEFTNLKEQPDILEDPTPTEGADE